VPHDLKIEQAWTGDGSLTLAVCRGEELSDLAPVRCGKGIRASMAYIVDDLKTLKDLRKLRREHDEVATHDPQEQQLITESLLV
jgi:hypothetical protein